MQQTSGDIIQVSGSKGRDQLLGAAQHQTDWRDDTPQYLRKLEEIKQGAAQEREREGQGDRERERERGNRAV